MSARGPDPISSDERSVRVRRVRRIAKGFGYVGQIEYRHVYSNSGGAQFGLGSEPRSDLLVVYAEAFTRDADPEDFSLEAILAHERGHQIIARTQELQRFLVNKATPATEEIMASILGSFLVDSPLDKQALILKSTDEVLRCGVDAADAIHLVRELRLVLEDYV